MKITLPSVPSQLLELCIADLRKCMADPRYIINMGVWHEPGWYNPDIKANQCAVCAGGAVLAQTLQIADDVVYIPDGNDDDDEDNNDAKIRAINAFRTGDIEAGLRRMRIKLADYDLPDEVSVASFRKEPELFFADMTRLIALLKGVGL